jgi:hypothetical protein
LQRPPQNNKLKGKKNTPGIVIDENFKARSQAAAAEVERRAKHAKEEAKKMNEWCNEGNAAKQQALQANLVAPLGRWHAQVELNQNQDRI